ncbi:MAG: winged helix-turn-helix transcriptional regulator [Hyphomicrobiales bacterium]|nr:winged helix-turn-helix transcriptional regulator [Hyphomicrobiales bacterium]
MSKSSDHRAMPGHLIRRAHQIAVAIFLEECAQQGITPVQFACLSQIAREPGADATRLSAEVALDRSTLGGVLERMESKDWIVRTGDPADARVKRLDLTPAGRALLASLDTHVERTQSRILAPLNPAERAQFVGLLEKMVAKNNEASRAPLGPRKAERRPRGR